MCKPLILETVVLASKENENMKNSKSYFKVKKINILLLIAFLLMISYLGVKGFITKFHMLNA